MKLQIVSDLHFEMGHMMEIDNAGADVLVLSGDVIVAEYFNRSEASPLSMTAKIWIDWFERTCAKFENVVYVLGNHEHYKGRFYETTRVLQSTLNHIQNLYLLDNASVLLEETFIIGTTLWTNFDNSSFKAAAVQNGLNDYRLIEGRDYRKLKPDATSAYHRNAVELIDHFGYMPKIVVVGHHAPSYRSITPEYLSGPYANLNPGYASHLDEFIRARPQIKLWTHGHVHSSHDYVIGETRIVANPRGYDYGKGPENKRFDPNLIVEI